MKRLLIASAIALLLIGCSTERQCARAAKRCAHLWHTDTAWVFDTLRFPPRSVRAVFNLNQVMSRDTFTFQNGRARLRFWRVGNDSAAADCDCPDTVIRYVRQVVTKNVQQRKWYDNPWVNNTAIGYAIGFVFGFWLMLWSMRRKN